MIGETVYDPAELEGLRAIRIIEAIAICGHASLAEVSDVAGVPKSTAHRIVGDLSAAGFLSREGSGAYSAGPRLFLAASNIAQQYSLTAALRPYLLQIVETLREDAYLSIVASSKEGPRVYYLDKAEGPQAVRMSIALGVPRPLHSSAPGKLALAFMSEQELASVLKNGLAKATEFTLTSEEDLLSELEGIRRTGVAISHQENLLGINGIAAGVFGEGQELRAGLVTSYPVKRGEHRESDMVRLMKEIAASASVGARGSS